MHSFNDTHDERRNDYLIEVPGPVKRAPACYQPVS